MHTEQERSRARLENGVDKNVVVLEIDDSEAIESSRVAELHQLEADIRRADEAAERDRVRPRLEIRQATRRSPQRQKDPSARSAQGARRSGKGSSVRANARMKFADKFRLKSNFLPP